LNDNLAMPRARVHPTRTFLLRGQVHPTAKRKLAADSTPQPKFSRPGQVHPIASSGLLRQPLFNSIRHPLHTEVPPATHFETDQPANCPQGNPPLPAPPSPRPLRYPLVARFGPLPAFETDQPQNSLSQKQKSGQVHPTASSERLRQSFFNSIRRRSHPEVPPETHFEISPSLHPFPRRTVWRATGIPLSREVLVRRTPCTAPSAAACKPFSRPSKPCPPESLL